MTAWRCLTFSIPEPSHEFLIVLLHEAGTLGVEVRGERVVAYFDESVDETGLLSSMQHLIRPAGNLLRLESSSTVPDGFWHERWMQNLKPFEIGSFLIVPGPATPHAIGGRRMIRLTPGRAFGTGEHATTRMCLMMIEKEMTEAATLLDVGTGSGILAIGARLLGAGTVVAVDTDAEAIVVARRNASMNETGDLLFVAGGPEALRESTRFDIVAANISGVALIRLMRTLCALCSATMILSGILSDEEEEVALAAAREGLGVVTREGDGDWIALTLKRRQP